MNEKAIIKENVTFGDKPTIGPFCIIGEKVKGENLKTKIGDNALVRSHTIIYAGNEIGDDFQTGHRAFIQEKNKIGNNVSIGTGSIVLKFCKLEDNVRIHTNAFIPEYTIIKRGAWIGPNVVMTNTLHPNCKKAKECMEKTKVIISERAVIGANAIIMPGVKIGKRAVIGAGTLVTKDVPDDSVFVGNPGKKIKEIKDLCCPFNLVEKPYGD